MSEHDATTTHRHESLWLLAPAALAVVALLAGLIISRDRPIPVTVDGRVLTVAQGTTVGDLERLGAFGAQPGRLMSVKGSVIETEGGRPAEIRLNGREVESEETVVRRDQLVSTNGIDVVEPTVTIREPIPVKTKITGKGPVMRLASPGSVGVRARVIGAVSKTTVSKKTLVAAQPMLVVRTRPRPKEKLIALSFDDGPWPGQTDKILKILKHEGVHATFFMLGVRVKKAPGLARDVAMAGNLVGNHTLGHRMLTKQKPKEIKRQISGGADVIYKATGVLPTWFRPPYGALNGKVWKQIRLSRMHVALWDIDTRDWSRPGVKHIVRVATKHAKSGSILLMHDGGTNRKQTIKALPKIIRKLKKRGFVFVTIQELADAK